PSGPETSEPTVWRTSIAIRHCSRLCASPNDWENPVGFASSTRSAEDPDRAPWRSPATISPAIHGAFITREAQHPRRARSNDMAHAEDPDVLVVGAGPVGLMAALFLKDRGLKVEIVDQDQRTTQRSYALALHPMTLGLLDEAGILREIARGSRRVDTVAFYE